ncbi:uncharacterized protein LOC127791431 [Diospyros lotus]|uniref:uncharacterized protein LOC127791431 n=1 Tax=Diospyros lotus TaxID=55363 RepID=UPI002255BBA1|nr:uncharacterized protein LOC127791431 [Diospyros lotus]
MGVNSRWRSSVPPSVAPVSSVSSVDRAEHWAKNLDNSVNAVSFGFVATAVLISMFLVMAILERFLRPRSAATGGPNRRDLDPHMVFDGKLNYPSPRMTTHAMSVLMPGDEVPTFIAHPAPGPCPGESVARPFHQHQTVSSLSSSSVTS